MTQHSAKQATQPALRLKDSEQFPPLGYVPVIAKSFEVVNLPEPEISSVDLSNDPADMENANDWVFIGDESECQALKAAELPPGAKRPTYSAILTTPRTHRARTRGTVGPATDKAPRPSSSTTSSTKDRTDKHPATSSRTGANASSQQTKPVTVVI